VMGSGCPEHITSFWPYCLFSIRIRYFKISSFQSEEVNQVYQLTHFVIVAHKNYLPDSYSTVFK